MDIASGSAEELDSQWRAAFRRRILTALDFLRGQAAFGLKQTRLFNAFNETYLNNQKFRLEVGKLTSFEMEVFCISSTKSQLEADSVYFTASEVTQALAFQLQDDRRGEIRNRILFEGHYDLPETYHTAGERAIPDQEDRVNDIQRWIQASLNKNAVQKLFDSMAHEYVIVPSPHLGHGVIGPTMQTNNSPPPLTAPTGSACAAPYLPNDPHSNNMALSISLSSNGAQVDLHQQPHLVDEALLLGSEFLDQLETVRDLRLALKEPRSRKSIISFLRFVFESKPALDPPALDRKLKLQKMNSIGLVLCSATYTEKAILDLSERRFRALLSHCCKFLGDPANVAASLPVDVIEAAATTNMAPEDHKAYATFLRGLEHHQARKVTPPSLPLWVSTRAERPSGFVTSMTWPQEHVAALLQRPLNTSLSILLGQLARLYRETGRDIPFPDDLTEALATASRSAPLNDRLQILDDATEILADSAPASAWAAIVLQRSVALRLQGNSHQSEHEILAFLDKISDIPEHLLKPLQLSLAKSRIYQFRYQEAHEIARRIEVGGDISEDKFQLLWDHIYCVGRIVRGQGDFESAKVCFERCCATNYGIRPSKVIITQCALADIYCELDHLSRGDTQHSYLLQAKSMLELAIKSVGKTNCKSRRRLLLSLSEVYIRQSRVHEATATLKELLALFDGLKCPDIVDRLGHVRLYMALARSCPSGQSVGYWREALRLNKAYNPSEEEVFTCAVIYLNLSWLSYCEGQSDMGQELYARASEVLKRRKPEYLLPGIGTYVYNDVLCKLGASIAGDGNAPPNLR